MIISYGPGLTERSLVTVRLFFLCLTHSQFHQINLTLPSRHDLLVEAEKSSKDSEFTAMLFVFSGLSKQCQNI